MPAGFGGVAGPATVLIQIAEDPFVELVELVELSGVQGAGVVGEWGFDVGAGLRAQADK